jgi:hypothetical protein
LAARPGPELALLILLLAGCARATQSAPVLSPGVIEEPVSAAIQEAFAADSRFESADSLWESSATAIADGQYRYEAPRFAAVGPGGQVAITSSRLEVRQSLIWVFLEYRWVPRREGEAIREGLATLLLTPRPDRPGWRIIHAHSSTSRS